MPQNTTSDGRIGWVSAGDGRSTSDILWSCFSVFLVCTWSCLHLNVPSIEESEAGWLKWHGVPYWPERPLRKKWTRKVLWMGAIILAPEVGVALATRDFLEARKCLTKVEGATGEENNVVNITKSHVFLANMGGFKVKLWIQKAHDRTSAKPEDGTQQLDEITPKDRPEGHFVEGIIGHYRVLDYLRPLCRDVHIPDEEDIKALSKRDSFTKLFAIVQSAWLVVQCIARAAVGLPITQLELATIAFVVCGIVMYGLWWNKPYGVERRELFVAITDEMPEMRYGIWSIRFKNENEGPNWYEGYRVQQPDILDLVDLGNITRGSDGTLTGGGQIALYLSGTIFSAFHILAWNWEFPNTPAKIIWRVLAITATGVGPALLLSFYLLPLDVIAWGLMIVYLISRIGLIVLIFYCFSSTPVDVYKTVEWTKFLPHFA